MSVIFLPTDASPPGAQAELEMRAPIEAEAGPLDGDGAGRPQPAQAAVLCMREQRDPAAAPVAARLPCDLRRRPLHQQLRHHGRPRRPALGDERIGGKDACRPVSDRHRRGPDEPTARIDPGRSFNLLVLHPPPTC